MSDMFGNGRCYSDRPRPQLNIRSYSYELLKLELLIIKDNKSAGVGLAQTRGEGIPFEISDEAVVGPIDTN